MVEYIAGAIGALIYTLVAMYTFSYMARFMNPDRTQRQKVAYLFLSLIASLAWPVTIPIGIWLIPKKDI